MISPLKNPLSPLQKSLIEALAQIPTKWALTPVKGNKAAYRAKWQHENPLSREALIQEIKSGRAKGYGIRTGIISGGIVAIDADGPAAHKKILELSGEEPLPKTIAFTSGKDERCQYLFYIPQEYWGAISTKKIQAAKGEYLELRWDGCQSVLPPSHHPETGFYRWRKSPQEIEIAEAPMWVIEAMLSEPSKPDSSPRPQPQQTKLDHHNRAELTEEEWALSYLSALSSYRADDYDDWLAVGMALHSVSDSLLTEWDNWSRQSQKYKPGDCDKKWKSFKSQGTKGIAIGTLAHMAQQDGWQSPFKSSGRGYSSGIGGRKQNPTGGSGGNGGDDGGNNVVNFPGSKLLTLEQIKERIDELIKNGITGSELTVQLNKLATNSPITIIELRNIYNQRSAELELDNERNEIKNEVDNLLKIESKNLDLNDYLPHDLSKPLTQWCEWLNILPQTVLTALLAGASSLHKTGTELVIHKGRNFTIPTTIFAALVAESGQKKSPIFANIIRKPLNILKREKQDVYKAKLEDYKEKLRRWEENEKKGEKPEEPKEPPIFYFTNATGESIPAYSQQYPQKTLLGLIDELAGHFNSANAYRSGRGSDKQDFLSYFDGLGQTVLRTKEGVRADEEKLYISMFGTIQPAVLKQLMEDCSDPDGSWARFLFVNQPLAAAELDDDDDYSIDINERIADFYRKIDRLPEMEYRLSHQAYKRYQPVYNQLERLRVTHPNPGMRAVYSKMEGYIGRIAINLHVLWELAAGKQCPDKEISLFIMEKAIDLAKFYIGQVRLIHANADDESLPTHILKMMGHSKRLEKNGSDGWIKAKQVQDLFAKKKRPSAQQVRDWMNEAIAMGYGTTRGNGNRLEYHWNSDNNNHARSSNSSDNLGNLGKLGEHLGNSVPQVETIENKELQTNLGNLGKGSGSSSPNNKSDGYKEIPPDLGNLEDPEMDIPLIEQKEPDSDPDLSEFSLKGGLVPQPSPSDLENSQDAYTVSKKNLGNTLPQVFPKCSPSSPSVPQVEEDDSDLIRETNFQLKRLGWTSQQGKDYLLDKYGKRSRQLLSIEELKDFLLYLESCEGSDEPTENDYELFTVGDKVIHPEYGEGTVRYQYSHSVNVDFQNFPIVNSVKANELKRLS